MGKNNGREDGKDSGKRMKCSIENYYQAYYESPLGKITMASDGENLIGLWLKGQKHFEKTVEGKNALKEDISIFEKTKQWLDDYFAGKRPEISELPLAPSGSEFRQAVWKLLCEIPYGEVTTYGEIARKIAKMQNIARMSAQAVGGAVGHNPISIIIPCHRVVGTDGSMTGYGGGIEKKEWLLKHEGVIF